MGAKAIFSSTVLIKEENFDFILLLVEVRHVA